MSVRDASTVAAPRRSRLIDLTGKRFGRWVVLARLPNQGKRHVWACRCDCSRERTVEGWKLRSSWSQSCGCLHALVTSLRVTTHGLSKTSPAYRSWKAMRQRCQNPNHSEFPRYGGRGIGIDPRWASFAAFLADMGERPRGHSLDRIDNDGPYAPSNCRWARAATQARNRRPPRRRRPDWSEPGEDGAESASALPPREWWQGADVADPGQDAVVDPDDPKNDLVEW